MNYLILLVNKSKDMAYIIPDIKVNSSETLSEFYNELNRLYNEYIEIIIDYNSKEKLTSRETKYDFIKEDISNSYHLKLIEAFGKTDVSDEIGEEHIDQFNINANDLIDIKAAIFQKFADSYYDRIS